MSPRRARKYPFRLVYQLMAVLLLMGIVPLFFSNRKLMDINQKALEDTILNMHTQAVGRLKVSVEMFLKDVRLSLQALANLQGMSDILGLEQRQSLLLNYLSANARVAGIKIYDGGGNEWMSAVRGQAFEAAFRELSVLRRGLEEVDNKGFFIGAPLAIAGHDSALLPLMIPIRSASGALLGILAAMVDLKEVQDMVAVARVGRSGRAFMVDRKGQVIAHQDRRKVLERADLSKLEIVGGYVLTGNTGGTIPFIEEDGREMLGAYDLVEGVGWGVVIEEPKHEAYLYLQQMRRQTWIWGILVSLAAVIVAAVVSQYISRPIRAFADRSLRVAKGDFRQTIDIRSRNEIGQLADTFNIMIRELDVYDRNMRELFLSTIKSLAAAVDAKDPYTRGHSDRVTQFSLALGRQLGLEGKVLEELQIAALLHDVGKIGIDDAILRKPGRLSEEEFAIIKMHPVFGAGIMSPIKQLREIIPGMKYHHEQFNGGGYPEGLNGEEIPLLARIIAIADSFDAMTSDRPYQKAMDDTHVLRTLVKLAGVRYDPQLVKAFVAAYPQLGRGEVAEASLELETATVKAGGG